jgi:hypothetical protein
MIKITSFYPFQNFLRITQEFHEDKAVIKSKSLSFEHNHEFSYKEVGEILDGFYPSRDQRFFGFFVIVISNMFLSIFCEWLTNRPIWLGIAQTTFISGLILYITSYIKTWRIVILDKNGNFLTSLWQNRKNINLIDEAVEKIKAKADNVEEIITVDPFPSNSPIFQHSYFQFAHLQRNKDNFYEEGIVGLEKSIFGESAYKTKYHDLSGNIYIGKQSDGVHGLVLEWGLLTLVIISGLLFGFGIRLGINAINFLYILGAIYALSWLATLVKRDVIGFYNKNGQIEYWAYVNRRDKEKVEKIIEFVKSKIPAEATSEE